MQPRLQPSEIFRNARCRGVIRSRCVSGRARVGAGRKTRPLLVQPGEQPLGRGGDLVAAEHAHELIDAGIHLQQLVLLALGQAAGDDHAAGLALLLHVEHFADRGVRLGPRIGDEGAGIDDDEIAAFRLEDHFVAFQPQQAGHALAIDQVFGAAQRDEAIAAFDVRVRRRNRPCPWRTNELQRGWEGLASIYSRDRRFQRRQRFNQH